jgi:hypothetical protein
VSQWMVSVVAVDVVRDFLGASSPCKDVLAGAGAEEAFIGLRRVEVHVIGTRERDAERRRKRRDGRVYQYAMSVNEPPGLNNAWATKRKK